MRKSHVVVLALALGALLAFGIGIFRAFRSAPAASKASAGADRSAPRLPSATRTWGDEEPQAPDPTSVDISTFGRVQGTVRDAVSRAPVAHVEVFFRAGGYERSVTSGSDGRYTLDLPGGRYEIRVLHDDYFGMFPGVFTLARGIHAQTLDLEVLRLATVEGHVRDPAGADVAGAEVTFNTRMSTRRAFSRDLPDFGTATSASDGAFRLRVIPGQVHLDAETPEARGRTFLRRVGPGETVGGVEIVLEKDVRISGVVQDPGGRPVPNAGVHAQGRSRRSNITDKRALRADEDGRFTFQRLPGGKVVLEARAPGFGPSPLTELDLEPGAETEVVLTLTTELRLSGRVVDHNGAPISGVEVILQREGSPLPAVASGRSDDDGRFEVRNIDEGPFHLFAFKGGYAPSEMRNVKAPRSDLEIELMAAGAIAGVVTDDRGQPVKDFTVRITTWTPAVGGNPRPGALGGTRFADEAGRFRMGNLDAGSYEILVSAPGFAPVRKEGVVIPPGGEGDGSVELGRAARVEGTVRDAKTGSPVVGARVRGVTGTDGAEVLTDGAGRFVLEEVAPGRRSIHVEHSEYVTRNETGLELRAGETRTVDVELTPLEGQHRLGTAAPMELSGIGATLGLREGRVIIAGLVVGGPAERAGIQRNDYIVSIDGEPTAEMLFKDAIENIRGLPGTTVRLGLERDGQELSVDVIRETVSIGRGVMRPLRR